VIHLIYYVMVEFSPDRVSVSLDPISYALVISNTNILSLD
jgi:hypothetical protein